MTGSSTGNRFFHLLPDWIIGAFCLSIPALYNSFPLVTADSGAYIGTGYTLQLPIDRPILYSIIVRIASLGISLWGVVAAQCIILSVLLQFLASKILGASYSRNRFAGVMLLMGVATSAGWFAGQIMPDIYTAILLLGTLILWMGPEKAWQRWCLYALMLGSVMVHNSNLLIALLSGLLLFIYSWRKKEVRLKHTARALLITGAIGWLGLSAMNSIADRRFSPSSASHVFLMSRMVENGMMDEFLSDYCPTDSASYKLCEYRYILPNRQWDFMWDEKSELYQTGGWEANREEYNRIIRKTLLSPKYLILHVTKSLHATFRQLPLIYVGDGLQKMGRGEFLEQMLYEHFLDEVKDYLSSAQMNDQLRIANWNMLIIAFSLLSICASLIIRQSCNQISNDPMHVLVGMCILFILINAFVTATLATVVGRYEARIFWILPFLSTLQLIRCLDRKRNSDAV